jgi:hypothetical protein
MKLLAIINIVRVPRHEHPLLKVPDDMRLGPRDRDRQHLTVGGPELYHDVPSGLGPKIMMRFLALGHRPQSSSSSPLPCCTNPVLRFQPIRRAA